jgi:hypothetical protein
MKPEKKIVTSGCRTIVVAAEPSRRLVLTAFDLSREQTLLEEDVTLVVQLSPGTARQLAKALTQRADDTEGGATTSQMSGLGSVLN